ncbi:hypothetical protein [Nocardia sp. NPDC004260]
MSTRARIGKFLRKWANRIDYEGAPKLMGWYFTFETGEGIRFREDGRGCRLAYLGDAEYEKAHTQAGSAEEDARRAERHRLIEIAMTEPDPVKAGEAAAELHRHFLGGGVGA